MQKYVTKSLEETLEYLGDGHTIEMIDGEYVIYRKYNNFDVEVSGANNNRKHKKFRLYIWAYDGSYKDVNSNGRVLTTLQGLKTELDRLAEL